MIKKILPAMIGAALVGGMSSAVADVTAMGHLDTAILYQDPGVGFNATDTSSTTNLVCTTCSFGFKGSEDLGNGLKAIFKIDFQFDMTERNSGGAITDRDQWLGLGSNFGKLRFGTISTVYKSHGAMLDPVYRTVLQGRDIGLQSALHTGAGDTTAQGRATNTFRYDSPTFSGFQVMGHYTLQSETAAASANSHGVSAVSGRAVASWYLLTISPATSVATIAPGMLVVVGVTRTLPSSVCTRVTAVRSVPVVM